MSANKGDSALMGQTFHNSDFADKRKLVELKAKKGLTISLAFPTLNEEQTIAKEILVLKTELMDRFPLIDEIVVIDSGSQDRTQTIAMEFGAKVFSAEEVLKRHGSFKGKGENLWKSLYVLSGDIVVWIDADIANIGPKFLYGLVGPLLAYDHIGYVKAFYERPMRSEKGLSASGGGRVTEILIRPLFSLFYPELALLVQPLSGEYAGRRSILEQLPFSVGYGVEVGHLIDLYHMFGAQVLAQVDMDTRIHRNQSIQSLSRMGFGILNTFLSRLEKYGEARLLSELGKEHISLAHAADFREAIREEISRQERPPMRTVSEYMERFYEPRTKEAISRDPGGRGRWKR